MPISLDKKLAGKEAEIVKTIKQFGIGGAMELYGVRSRLTFSKWVRENTNGEWQPSNLAYLRGADKHKWMTEHRETILDCLEIFGREITRDMFCLTEDGTLERFIKYDGRLPTQKLTRLERAELNAKEALYIAKKLEKQMELVNSRFPILDEGQLQTRLKYNELVEQVNNFETRVAGDLGGLFTLALRYGLEKFTAPAKEMLPQPPDLSINYLLEQREEAWETKEAEERVRKEAKLAAKEKAKRETQEKAEEAKKAREAKVVARKEAELATKEKAKREAEEAITKAQWQQQSFSENPLVTTIARLKVK